MTQKEFNISPGILMNYCKQIYRLEEQIETTDSTLVIKKGSSLKSFGEIIYIEIQQGETENSSTLKFKSENKYNQGVDWGKNAENENEFLTKLEKLIF